MPNLLLTQMDSFVSAAADTYQYLSGNYLNNLEGCYLKCGETFNNIEALHFVKICGYRKLSNDKKTFEIIKSTVYECLEGFHYEDNSIGYFVVGNHDHIDIYLAAEENGFAEKLKGVIPDLVTDKTAICTKEWKSAMTYGGVITGRFDVKKSVIDGIIQALHGKNCLIGVLAKPLRKTYRAEYMQEIVQLSERCKNFESMSRSLGSISKTDVNYTYPSVEMLREYLAELVKKNQEDSSGLWEYCIYFGSEEQKYADLLGKMLKGALSVYASSLENGHCYFLDNNPIHKGQLGLIEAEYREIPAGIPYSFIKSALVSRTTSKELAGLLQFPLDSYQGIKVHDINRTADWVNSFSKVAPRTGEEKVELGNIYGMSHSYALDYNALRGHMLSIGATGEGKTNSTMVVLTDISQKKLPFLVIEPAKRDYWHLVSAIDNLKVYSPGADAFPLKINPLAPEDGVIVSNHVEELMYAFAGAFEMETPVKLTIEGLLRYTYEKAGWNMDEVAYRQAKRYPTIQDVLCNLDEFSQKEIRSGSEVRQDIEGAVWRRIQSLSSGSMGRITTMEENSITGKDLANQSIVIELESLSVENKAFVTSLLLIKYNQYIRQQDASERLKRLLVLEEAHNVLKEESNNIFNNIASEYFVNMLAEIREFGTGVIIADQRSARIHSSAIANTKIKMIGAIDSEEDVDKIAFALRMNQFQKERIPELVPGEVLIAVRGEKEVCKVNVKRHIAQMETSACILCPCRQYCEKENVRRTIKVDTRRRLIVNKLYDVRFDSQQIRTILEDYLKTLHVDKCYYVCALGFLLSESDCSELESRQIIYRYLYAV